MNFFGVAKNKGVLKGTSPLMEEREYDNETIEEWLTYVE
jgi:hypothetical protein